MKRTTKVIRKQLAASPEEIFPLLCPTREYEWIKGWDRELIYSKSGIAEIGAVFVTDFGREYDPETWVICEYSPSQKIAFVRTSELRSVRFEIFLIQNSEGTEIIWKHEITALNGKGEELLAKYTDEDYNSVIVPLFAMLEYFIKNDKMMEMQDNEV